VDNDELRNLEGRIDQLIEVCQRLQQENRSLRVQQQDLNTQHTRLMEKTRLARARIEAMIGRLKALERA
jgi:cell division protein ZapB